MRKTIVIAVRDYLAAVKTKSFLISLILMPVLMFGGLAIGRLSQNMGDTRPKKVAVIDRTVGVSGIGGRPLYQVLIDRAQQREQEITNERGEYTAAPFRIEHIPIPENPTPEQLDQVRYELSEQIREGELFAFIEIGPSAVTAPPEKLMQLAGALGGVMTTTQPSDAAEAAESRDISAAIIDEYGIRYTSQNTTYMELQQWLHRSLTPEIYQRRIALAELPPQKVMPLIVPPVVQQRAMAVKNDSGQIVYEKDPNPITSFIIPIVMLFLMFTVIMTAAQPLTTNIVEEKQLRIAEVLLGSVRPFELMLGKLLGGVSVSLTLAAIYLVGGMFLAKEFQVLDAVPPSTIGWFLLFAALGTLMYGSLFVAAGAAVTNLKEAQNLLTPIILLVVSPMFVFPNVIQNPEGPLARGFTYFPLTSPMAAVLRLAVPPGLETSEKMLAAGISLAMTLVLIWIAGRVFRFGMLHTDKAAAMKDMVKWVVRG